MGNKDSLEVGKLAGMVISDADPNELTQTNSYLNHATIIDGEVAELSPTVR